MDFPGCPVVKTALPLRDKMGNLRYPTCPAVQPKKKKNCQGRFGTRHIPISERLTCQCSNPRILEIKELSEVEVGSTERYVCMPYAKC